MHEKFLSICTGAVLRKNYRISYYRSAEIAQPSDEMSPIPVCNRRVMSTDS